MKLTEKQQFLMDTYYELSEAFERTTHAILARPEVKEQALMQAHVFAALLNDFISTIPGVPKVYIYKLVDYVYNCRAEVLGPEPTMPRPPASDELN
jgi:Tfp pilus assembly protein PilN